MYRGEGEMLRIQKLDSNESIPVGSAEIIRCKKCGKHVARTAGSNAFFHNPDEYYFCQSCQTEIEEEVVWCSGIKVKRIHYTHERSE